MEQSFLWIKSAISSSFTEFHLNCCKSLVELFTNKYEDEPDFFKYHGELIEEILNKETFLSIIA